jgi:hypothetical protein
VARQSGRKNLVSGRKTFLNICKIGPIRQVKKRSPDRMSVGNLQISVIPPTAVPTAAAIPAAASANNQQNQTQATSKTTAVAKVATPVKAVTPVVNTSVTDAANLSTTAVVLSGLESQLTTSKPSDFKNLLESAARSIYNDAAQQDSKEQSKTLENIADRLQFAANIAGLSSFSPLTIEAFLE